MRPSEAEWYRPLSMCLQVVTLCTEREREKTERMRRTRIRAVVEQQPQYVVVTYLRRVVHRQVPLSVQCHDLPQSSAYRQRKRKEVIV
jgi:hypothetical protein